MTITLTAQTTTVKRFFQSQQITRTRISEFTVYAAKDLKKWNGKRYGSLVKTEINTGTVAQACMEASSNKVN